MKILYVEDNSGDASLLQYQFAKTAPTIEVEWVETHKEAIKRLSLCAPDKPCYDLVLTEMNLPDGNGISIISFIRDKGLWMPVVIITGMGDEASAINALNAGASDYIIKGNDYLTRLPAALDLAINKFRIEAARRYEPLHVLYCEDNPQDIESTQRYISVHAPYILLDVVATYQEVLERFSLMEEESKSVLKPCDILLLNYQLNNITAIELLKDLRGIFRTDVPVVIMSEEENQEIAAQALRLGADDYIVKSRGYLYQLPIVLESAFNKVQLERERAALKASEYHFRLLIENISDLILVLDENGVVRYCSPSIERIVGFKPEETIGKRFDEAIHPDDIPKILSDFSRITKTPGVASEPTVLRIMTRDGSWKYMEAIARSVVIASGRAMVIINSRDITERKKSEEALQESEAKYRSLVENSLVGVCIIQDEKYIFVNNKFCQIHGFALEEIIDKSGVMDFIYANDRETIKDNIMRILKSGDAIEWDFRIVRKDNQVCNVKGFFSPVIYKGRPAVIGTLIDTTREKLLENQLRQSHKMEAIGTLAGGIAHDFNNILTVLTGYGTLLKMEMEKGLPLRKNYVDAILSASMKAAGLTQGLLAFARQQAITLKPVMINEIVMGTEKMLRRLLTEDITLKTNLSSEDIVVMADPTQIDQILINLAVNARDAMPRGGTVIIETRTIYLDSQTAEIKELSGPGEYALLSVTDTGTGMDEATKEHLFEPFFTTKEVGKGTGLGLSTVYGIVKQHKGYISVYSEKSMGTSFHIYLPLTDEIQTEELVHVMPVGGPETILLAEDNEDVRNFMATALTRSGYHVVKAVDGEEAIERFKTNNGISLLILDSVMPKKNGRQVYDEISATHPDVKIIFTSGYTRDVVLDKGIEDKKFDFIAKPVSPDTLLKKVREVLDR